MAFQLDGSLALALRLQGVTSFYDGALNADRFIAFLRRPIKDAEQRVFLIVDNLKVHHVCQLEASDNRSLSRLVTEASGIFDHLGPRWAAFDA